jgi:hypothetical protein
MKAEYGFVLNMTSRPLKSWLKNYWTQVLVRHTTTSLPEGSLLNLEVSDL